MVMDSKPPSPQSVGREFVRQYYTLLNQAPLHLHRFYSTNSSFVHGGLDANDKTSEPVHGQQDIHQRIKQLNFRDCKAKIRQVDAHATIGNGVVVQVSGELSNHGQPMRRFMQTFVLALQSAKKYYVHNDIFRYQDEVFSEDEHDEGAGHVNVTVENLKNVASQSEDGAVEMVAHNNNEVTTEKYQQQVQQPNVGVGGDGITTVSINAAATTTSRPDPSSRSPAKSTILNEQEVPKETEFRLNGNNDNHLNEKQKEPTKELTNAGKEISFAPAEVVTTSPATPSVASSTDGKDVEVDEKSSQPSEFQPTEETARTGKSASTTPTPTTSSSDPVILSYAHLVKSGPGANVSISSAIPVSSGSLPSAGFSKVASPVQSQVAKGDVSKESTPSPAAGNFASGAAGQGGKGFRGTAARMSGTGGHRTQSGSSVSLGQGSGGRYYRDDEGREDRHRRRGQNANVTIPDSQQLFVGNLPHNCLESDLETLFEKFGKVAEIRISSKGMQQSKVTPTGQKIPNFGFVAFESEQPARKCLSQTPILLNNGHRLNVEPKKTKQMRAESMGGGNDSFYQGGTHGGTTGGGGGGIGSNSSSSSGSVGQGFHKTRVTSPGGVGGNLSSGVGNYNSHEHVGGSGPRPGVPGGGRGGSRGGGSRGGGGRGSYSGSGGRGGASGVGVGGVGGGPGPNQGGGASNRGAYGSRRS